MADNWPLPAIDPSNLEKSKQALIDHIGALRAAGHDVYFEAWNETHKGQAAINVLNGLPPAAYPSEVKGQFNDWLASVSE